jgi:hypothetical protein
VRRNVLVLLALLVALSTLVDAQRARARRIRAHPPVTQGGSCSPSPCIASTSGTLSHGNTSVTITGLGFGSKSTPAPTIWDDCEGTTITTLWSGGWPDTQTDSNDVIGYRSNRHSVAQAHSHSTKYLSGAHGLPSNASNAGWNVAIWKNYTMGSFPQYSYWNYWARDDPSYTYGDNHKLYDFFFNGEPLDGVNWYLEKWPDDFTHIITTLWHLNEDNSPYTIEGAPPASEWYGDDGPSLWSAGWRKVEHIIKWTNVSRGGYIKSYENAIEVMNLTTLTDAYSGTSRGEALGTFDRIDHTSNNTRYFDDIYFDHGTDALARVMLCAGSTYATRGICEMQRASSWSSTSITVTFNHGSFAVSSTKYLYVRDNTDTGNSNGFAVVLQ